jgi:hypothetical protein
MEQRKVPLNWEDHCWLFAKSATGKSMDLALEWISRHQLDVNEDGHLVPIQDWISNPFSIMPDQHETNAKQLCTDFLATLALPSTQLPREIAIDH